MTTTEYENLKSQVHDGLSNVEHKIKGNAPYKEKLDAATKLVAARQALETYKKCAPPMHEDAAAFERLATEDVDRKADKIVARRAKFARDIDSVALPSLKNFDSIASLLGIKDSNYTSETGNALHTSINFMMICKYIAVMEENYDALLDQQSSHNREHYLPDREPNDFEVIQKEMAETFNPMVKFQAVEESKSITQRCKETLDIHRKEDWSVYLKQARLISYLQITDVSVNGIAKRLKYLAEQRDDLTTGVVPPAKVTESSGTTHIITETVDKNTIIMNGRKTDGGSSI